jgi:hypothetical protein
MNLAIQRSLTGLAIGTICAVTGTVLNEGTTPAQSKAYEHYLPANTQPYGIGDGISAQDAASLTTGLAWPQSDHAITSRYGYPDAVDGTNSYYEGPSGWVKVSYGADGRAIAAEVQ